MQINLFSYRNMASSVYIIKEKYLTSRSQEKKSKVIHSKCILKTLLLPHLTKC